MAGIEFSAGMMAGLPARIIRLSTDVNDNSPNCGLLPAFLVGNLFNAHAAGAIRIMKGAVPTDFSGLTSRSSRSTDILVKFQESNFEGYASNDFGLVQQNVNPVVISTTYVNAAASGVATWFWWLVIVSDLNGNWATAPIHQIVGTVGTAGSGSDLEINDTNVVTGQGYRIRNLRMIFPSSWSY